MIEKSKTMERVFTGAVDIGGTKIQVGIVDAQGEVMAEYCFFTDPLNQSGEQAMDRIVELIDVQCQKLGLQRKMLRGIGVSCCGPVNTETGTVENPYTLPGWLGFPMVSRLSEKSGLAVRLENDANGALLGEILMRQLHNHKVLMITIGTGIGVAFWDQGKLYRNGRYHPEMGHIIVSSENRECYCGHSGCFESCCSGKAVNERAIKAGFADFDELYCQAKTKDLHAVQQLDRIRRDLINGIWSLNIIFKPDTVILAGGFSQKYFEFIRTAVQSDSQGKEDFIDAFHILPAFENKNSALAGANMLF